MPSDAFRAAHSVSCDLFLLVATGACNLTIEVYGERHEYRLTRASEGVHVSAHTWLLLGGFAPGTVILVHAEKLYQHVSYLSEPE